MKYGLGLGVAALLIATVASADAVKPTAVVYADGAVDLSLSGQPGDPTSGAAIMNKGAGIS